MDLTYFVRLAGIKEVTVKISFVFHLFQNVDMFHQGKYLLYNILEY
jgi:hypothetical protein